MGAAAHSTITIVSGVGMLFVAVMLGFWTCYSDVYALLRSLTQSSSARSEEGESDDQMNSADEEALKKTTMAPPRSPSPDDDSDDAADDESNGSGDARTLPNAIEQVLENVRPWPHNRPWPLKSQGALEVPGDRVQMFKLLIDAGIDTSSWGDGTETLRDQLVRKECWLTYSGNRIVSADATRSSTARNSEAPKLLVRRVRLMVVKIAATFPDGIRILRCTGSNDNDIKALKANIGLQDDMDEVRPGHILRELQLPLEWQELHFDKVSMDKSFWFSTRERGDSFPGLSSQYFCETVCLKVKDINAESIAGMLNFPGGRGTFDVVVGEKARTWEWKPATNDEVSAFGPQKATQK